MANADAPWRRLDHHDRAELNGPQASGIVLRRPDGPDDVGSQREALPAGSISLTHLDGKDWLRNVAANQCADSEMLRDAIERGVR